MSVLVDSNVLLRRAQVASAQHRSTLYALTELVRARMVMFVVPQVVYEFWSAATRPIKDNGLGMEPAVAERSVAELLRDFVILKDERGIFGTWQSLVSIHGVRGKHTYDALLIAAMQRHGISNLLTFNVADFKNFPSINAFSPEDVQAGRLPL